MTANVTTKTEAERLLAELVSMPTITDDALANDMALDYIENYLVERGMFSKRFHFDGHGALVATTRQGAESKTPAVLLSAHVDVMTGDESLFMLKQEGDKLLGRGTYDMKFAIAAYMQLVDDLRDNLADYNFGIIITTDEEYGGRDGINATPHILNTGYKPGVVILPDGGTDYAVENLAKGHWRFDLIAQGRTAHGSRPWEGESASFKLIQALHDLKVEFKDHGPNTDTLNIGILEGGHAYNQVPDLMTAAVEIRLAGSDSYNKNKVFIEKICKHYGLECRTRVVAHPCITDTSLPEVQSFMASIKTVTGADTGTCISYAASDGEYYAAKGITVILTRPTGGSHHSASEWISRKSFLQLTPILHDYLAKMAKENKAAS